MSAKTINNSNSNIQLSGSESADYIYNNAHHVTITGGKQNDTVEFGPKSSRSVYNYAEGDGNDTIIGFDNFTEGTIHLTSGAVSDYSIINGNHHIKIGKGSITLKDVKTDKVSIKTPRQSYRYVNGKAFNDPDYNGNNFYSNDPVKGTVNGDYINVGGDKVTINAGAGDDYINIDNTYANKHFLINAEAGDDTLKNIGSYSTFVGGLGNDIIYSNSYEAVIKYSKGDGNDTVYGYNSTDTLQIINSNYSTTASGQDVIINVEGGKILLKDSISEELNIKAVSPPPKTLPPKSLEAVKLTNKDKSPYTAAANVGSINASKRKKAARIIGNSNNNSITGSIKNDTLIGGSGDDTLIGGKGKDTLYGDEGNDVIKGGKGNDKIYGGEGADTFIYSSGDGNDVIVDFTSDDVIKLGSKKTKVNKKKSKISGNDYILAIGRSKIRLTGAANQPITVIDYAGNSKIFNDDNFATSQLNSILETKSNIISSEKCNEKTFNYNLNDLAMPQEHSLGNTPGQVHNVNNH